MLIANYRCIFGKKKKTNKHNDRTTLVSNIVSSVIFGKEYRDIETVVINGALLYLFESTSLIFVMLNECQKL